MNNKKIEINSIIPLVLDKEIDLNTNTPLVLDKEIYSSQNINNEILKINDLVKAKYLNSNTNTQIKEKISEEKDFTLIKNTTKNISNFNKGEKLSINKKIEGNKIEIKPQYNEKKFLDRNKIQSEIMINQQALIDNFKSNIHALKSTIKNEQEKNIKLQSIVNSLESHKTEIIINNKQLTDKNKKIKFYQEKIKYYQEENIRLSSELNFIKDDHLIIKNNYAEVEIQKNSIYKQIQELNDLLFKPNTVETPFLQKVTDENSIIQNDLNNIPKNNLHKHKEKSELNKDLDTDVTDIFN